MIEILNSERAEREDGKAAKDETQDNDQEHVPRKRPTEMIVAIPIAPPVSLPLARASPVPVLIHPDGARAHGRLYLRRGGVELDAPVAEPVRRACGAPALFRAVAVRSIVLHGRPVVGGGALGIKGKPGIAVVEGGDWAEGTDGGEDDREGGRGRFKQGARGHIMGKGSVQQEREEGRRLFVQIVDSFGSEVEGDGVLRLTGLDGTVESDDRVELTGFVEVIGLVGVIGCADWVKFVE